MRETREGKGEGSGEEKELRVTTSRGRRGGEVKGKIRRKERKRGRVDV